MQWHINQNKKNKKRIWNADKLTVVFDYIKQKQVTQSLYEPFVSAGQ